MPVAATSAGSAAKARRIAAQASRARRVSASTVITASVSMCSSAALSAAALPPCGTRSQRRFGWVVLGALSSPSGACTSPYWRVSTPIVSSVEPSSAKMICCSGSLCENRPSSVTLITLASL